MIGGGWSWVDADEAGGAILVIEKCVMGERKHRLVAVIILVVLEYAFQLISIWAMAMPTLPAPMTEILVWRLVEDGGVALWSDREGEEERENISKKIINR
jgi:hypothetical protein